MFFFFLFSNRHKTSIPRRYYINTSKIKYQWISALFLVIFVMQCWWRKNRRRFCTLCTLTLYTIISMSEKFSPFRWTLFGVIFMSEKATSFRCKSFGVISMSKKSSLLRCTFSEVILMDEKSASCDFNELKTDTILPSLFGCIFEWQELVVVFIFW